MTTLKSLTLFMLMALLAFTSCQDEIDEELGQNPNTNSADSITARNLERTAMYDGSNDDFLDGNSCSSIVLPVTVTVNGTQVTVVNESDYQLVTDILAQFNTDNDTVELQFPITVILNNYTELTVASQADYDFIIDACQQAEANAQDAISCLDIDFPIAILTYNLSSDQTGSIVFDSEQSLFGYINNLGSDELFAIDYPINVMLSNGTTATLQSDVDLQSSIDECLSDEEIEDEAENFANILEEILVDGLFQIESFANAGVDTAISYSEFTIDFANDLTVTAENVVNTTVQDVQGTYEVTSEAVVYLDLEFSGNATFLLLNHTYVVESFSSSTIALQSTANPAITLVLTQL